MYPTQIALKIAVTPYQAAAKVERPQRPAHDGRRHASSPPTPLAHARWSHHPLLTLARSHSHLQHMARGHDFMALKLYTEHHSDAEGDDDGGNVPGVFI